MIEFGTHKRGSGLEPDGVQPNVRICFVQVHAMLRKELDSLKAKHKDMMAELKTYKDRVRGAVRLRHQGPSFQDGFLGRNFSFCWENEVQVCTCSQGNFRHMSFRCSVWRRSVYTRKSP